MDPARISAYFTKQTEIGKFFDLLKHVYVNLLLIISKILIVFISGFFFLRISAIWIL